MPSFFLNSYVPLVASKYGREASVAHSLPPFIDGSIRREPDFQQECPAITCLCRAGKFAPRLGLDDVVAYSTRKGRYGQGRRERRLTCVLRVIDALPGHAEGAAWYLSHRLRIPSNCWVEGNPAEPFDKSHGLHPVDRVTDPGRIQQLWDLTYRERSQVHPRFVVCERLYQCLEWNAIQVTDDHLREAFGRVPGTQNPPMLPIEQGQRLMHLLGLDIQLQSAVNFSSC